ncbi:helix-turn-helix transcriptional regulator [Paractinoplanes rishiriensis]|uniref:HTH araC/xylS-type domain-containing protein n=1 Tax=Paractinoplanes rishiriensis TaxID=1050105 RepID=A0A919MWX7_9ACTN|nr:helix-turn-helix transcriptional regulator [Actinoplanes rishiriensis]GIE95120.1 hypothetical protein Ari01nite_25850 [Actinoplanes rishiriensis]
MIHSVPTRPQTVACETATRAPHPALQRYVVGYGAFRSGTRHALAHRLLPFGLVTLILDPDEELLATGARPRMTEAGPTRWGSGVTVALTPAGVPALLGIPMSELTGQTVPLTDLPAPRATDLTEPRTAGLTRPRATILTGPRATGLTKPRATILTGRRAVELADRLAAAPDWSARFTMLDDLLTGALFPGAHLAGTRTGSREPQPEPRAPHPGGRRLGPDPATLAAWRLLHRSRGRLRVGAVATEVGVPRRQLERAFRQHFGMSPGAVQRVARFQRAADLIGLGVPLAAVAARSGYADQSHLSRETRDLAGWTPGELRAIVQYREMAAA